MGIFDGWSAGERADIQQVLKIFEASVLIPHEKPPTGIGKLRTKAVLERLDISLVMYDTFLNSFGIDKAWEKENRPKNSGARYDFIRGLVGGGWTTPRYGKYSQAVSDAQIARYIGYHEIYKRYGIFVPVGLRAPGATEFTWLDFDVDHARHNFHDKRIVTIVETFGEENCLVQYREQSGNFSILMRCVPMYWQRHGWLFGRILERIGLEVKDGNVEIYPRRDRGRRLPFGDQLVFTGTDALNGANNPLPTAKSKLEAFNALMENHCIDPNKILEKLPRWKPRAAPTDTSRDDTASSTEEPKKKKRKKRRPKKKPLGFKKSKETSDKAANDNSKREKRIHENTSYDKQMQKVEREGLKEPGTRFNTQKRLVRWLYGKGLVNEAIIDRVSDWYNSGKTNGFSKDWKRSPEEVLRNLRRHVVTFCAWLDKFWRDDAGNEIDPLPITTEDAHRMGEICDWDLHQTIWGCHMLQFAKARKQHQKHLYLSARTMRTFRFGRDADKKALQTLIKKGVLKYVKRNYILGERSRVWVLNWKFSNSGKIIPVDFNWRQMLFVSFSREELYAHTTEKMGYETYSRWTVRRILDEGKEIENIELQDASTCKAEQGAANDNKEGSDNQEQDRKEYANDNTDARQETRYSNGAGNAARAP